MQLPDAGDGIDRAAPLPAPPATWRYRKRRRAVVLLFLVLAVIVLLVGQILRDDETAEAVPQEPVAAGPPVKARVKTPAEARRKAPGKAPAAGFAFTGGYGPVLGSTGTLRRFKVAAERRLRPGDGRDFADEVDRILGDSRSWIAGRQFRLRRVPASAAAEFTIYLASAGASERMCAAGGLRTEGFTSCRLPGRVIINNDRWVGAVPGYGAPLAVYRAYAINHEVGHQLGHGHEACAGRGEPAPVMMQQTFGLKGCVANAWPYLRGERYAGNPVS
ncbi:hypothetical protein DMB66_29240 [Actinoplanes sp. ATCC 53533]|uniref:DUF3152 domain-containing protein n=1 Tax=Actinoplanes sp. ATCC 53533 TaxID=1288362 RepID=UPI000F7A350F|nr:DUF3152 domain-containing protein [Actinoplanes sp. ATCC 53533]RSM58506.1 hypothetical protein DMB66_29240 [Actinoplanes sp. ATCC 53533]